MSYYKQVNICIFLEQLCIGNRGYRRCIHNYIIKFCFKLGNQLPKLFSLYQFSWIGRNWPCRNYK